MIKQYLIDGNNVIGKSKSLWGLQKSEKQQSREQLVLMVDKYFVGKKITVVLYFDGFKGQNAYFGKSIVKFSNSKTADEIIRRDIENLSSPKVTAVVSSDHSIQNLARACSCKVIKSEDFVKMIENKIDNESEQAKIKSIDNDEIKRMFGVE